MHSHKTLYLNDTFIKFIFDDTKIQIEISINDNIEIINRPHTQFIDTFNELITEYNISNHSAKLIKIWFNKNQRKLLPIKEYTTRYGRKTYLGSSQ